MTDFVLSNPNIERAILGGCLLEPDQFPRIAPLLSPADFSLDSHRRVFGRMVQLANDGKPLDIVTLTDALEQKKELQAVGDVGYISSLVDGVPDRPSLEHYARILLDKARRRRLQAAAQALAGAVEDSSRTTDDCAKQIQESLLAIEVRGKKGQNSVRKYEQIPDLMTMDIPPMEPLVDGMIARKTLSLWTGPDGAAKTFLVQKMGIAVATGGQFLGRRCQRAPVLYLDYENPSFAVRDRIELMASGPIDWLKIWGTWLEQQPPQIGNELLLTIAKETKPLIIVDPFRYAHGAEENDSTEMMAVMQSLRYCAAAGGAVIVVHHPAKAEGSTGRGSSAIRGAVDVAFLQELSDESGLITLRCVKNRFGERSIVTIRPDFDEGTFEVTDSPQFTDRAKEMERLKKIITEQPGISQNAICKFAGGMKARIGRLLKEGVEIFWQTQPGPNRSVQYFPVGWFPNLRTTTGTTEPQGAVVSGSVVLSPIGENHQNHHPPPVSGGSISPEENPEARVIF